MSYSKFNLEILENLVNTQYGDYGGLVQVDRSDSYDFNELCEEKGVNMEKYFLVGIHFGSSSLKNVSSDNSFYCFALLLDKKKYGSSFDEISKYLEENQNVADIKSVNFKINFADLAKCMKRFNAGFVSSITNHIDVYNIQEEL
ncbi:hypothetical protein [Flavimarina sp. Hel_I_48]|uniref:hypothetical protein n=1 Tax=Flavimarina sp. Hel_I_48 TaxID=1392488 RepID=UPI0004DFCC7A|nr:hypothetical protein [Flavimarina sp. Hel_I_48]